MAKQSILQSSKFKRIAWYIGILLIPIIIASILGMVASTPSGDTSSSIQCLGDIPYAVYLSLDPSTDGVIGAPLTGIIGLAACITMLILLYRKPINEQRTWVSITLGSISFLWSLYLAGIIYFLMAFYLDFSGLN